MASLATSRRVLVVDDEPQIREVASLYLERAGYATCTASDGATALQIVGEDGIDLMVLDLMLPGIDGFEVLDRIRSTGSDLPIIVLSARGNETERALGLELGADDYIAKPASPREMVARVRAVLRRARPEMPSIISVGSFEIDVERRELVHHGQPVAMPRREFDLLAHLARSPGTVFSRAELLADVWGSSSEWQDPATVTVHVRRLRSKIEQDPSNPQHLIAVYGVGYRFES